MVAAVLALTCAILAALQVNAGT
ncbi:MAG: hypothetical protein RL701_4988, partial [Pseudomonadota bacterium]